MVSAWKETVFSTVTVKKPVAIVVKLADHCAIELFAPKLIHDSRNCSIVHTLVPDSSRGETLLVKHDVE
jgi:hypothetical protein